MNFNTFKDACDNCYVEIGYPGAARGYAFPTEAPDTIVELLEYVDGLEDEYSVTTSEDRIIISSKGEDCDATFYFTPDSEVQTALDVLNKYKELVNADVA